jgi:bifunctional DNA-binding transcriptional regulator/antitoxin component of YhaV-PrlF toxin-antitoxin module
MIYGVVKIGSSGHSNSLIVTIPADIKSDLGLQVGEKLLVSVDEQGRIIYERQKPLRVVAPAQQPQPQSEPKSAVSAEGTDPDIGTGMQGWE